MFNKDITKVYEETNSSIDGLSQSEATKRQKKFGKNILEDPKKEGFLKTFFKQFLNIMVGILLVSAVVSIVMAVMTKQYADLFEGIVILFIVLMNSLIGVFQEKKAQACLDSLRSDSYCVGL